MNKLTPRIAIVSQDPENRGGVLRLVHYAYDRLIEAGCSPTLLHYASYKVHPELSVTPLNLIRGNLGLVAKSKSYTFEGMDAIAIGAAFPEWEPNRISSNSQWQNILNDFDAAILVTGSAHPGYPLVQSGKKFVAWISSTVSDDRRERLAASKSFESSVEKLSLPIIKERELAVLQSATRILAVSNDAKYSIKSLKPELKAEVFPFPIDTNKFNPTGRPQTPGKQILFVGRANDPRKRINLFLDALQILRGSVPDVHAVVVSSEPVTELKATSYKDIAPLVELRKSLSEYELIATYRQSAVFVLTSEQEGLGIAAMEAMACETPVVSTRCGGPETFIQDGKNGFLTSSTAEAIASRVSSILTNKELAASLGTAAAQSIYDKFSESSWNERFISVIRTLT